MSDEKENPYEGDPEYEYVDDDGEVVEAHVETMSNDIVGQIIINALRKVSFRTEKKAPTDKPVIGNIHLAMAREGFELSEIDRAMGHLVEAVWNELKKDVEPQPAMRGPVAMDRDGELVRARTVDTGFEMELEDFYEACRSLEFDEIATEIAHGAVKKLEEIDFEKAYIYEACWIKGPYDPEEQTTIGFATRWGFA